MRLINNGGRCCGVKEIYGLPYHPSLIVNDLEEDPLDGTYPDAGDAGGFEEFRNPGKRFYTGARDQETAEDRLRVYLEYLDEMRPDGICQIILNVGVPGDPDEEHQRAWIPLLKKLGFTRSVTSLNSNSGNTIAIYHRKSGA